MVYIGHGTPVKTFIFTFKNISLRDYINHKIENWNYKYIVASSNRESENLQKCFHKKSNSILISGNPRNDLLRVTTDKFKTENHRIFLYAPTHREGKGTILFPFKDIDMQRLNSFLTDNRIIIYLKTHINDRQSTQLNSLSSIKIITDDIDLHTYMNEFDGLITDYSSLMVDFMLLERPIIYLDYDREAYENSRGFLYNFDEITPGKKPRTQEDFELSLLNKELPSQYLEIKKKFHKYEAGFTRRLVESVHF